MKNKNFKLSFVLWCFCMILIGVFLSLHKGHSAISFKEAKQVFSNIQNAAGHHVILKLDPNLYVMAYSDDYSVFISQGMLNFCNKSDIALVLGHELTHIKYKDASRFFYDKKYELRADEEGYYYCKKAGYKHCKQFMLKMQKAFGNGEDKHHPSWKYRYNNLKGK